MTQLLVFPTPYTSEASVLQCLQALRKDHTKFTGGNIKLSKKRGSKFSNIQHLGAQYTVYILLLDWWCWLALTIMYTHLKLRLLQEVECERVLSVQWWLPQNDHLVHYNVPVRSNRSCQREVERHWDSVHQKTLHSCSGDTRGSRLYSDWTLFVCRDLSPRKSSLHLWRDLHMSQEEVKFVL